MYSQNSMLLGLTYNLRHFDSSSATGGGVLFGPDPENKVTVNGLI